MKNFLFIVSLFFYSNVQSQIRVVLKSNHVVTSSRVEFTKNTVLMDEYDKINSKIFEMDKSYIKTIVDSSGKIIDFKDLVSSKKSIEELKNSYNDSKETIVNPAKRDSVGKVVKKQISEDSLNVLFKTLIGLPEKEDKIFIEEVITLKDTVKKDIIYLAIMEWISKAFNSSKAVIDFQDKAAGKIICKGYSESLPTKGVLGSDALLIDFSMNFTIKDGKYRIQMYNLSAKEKHYDSATMSVIQALSTTPSTRNDPYPIDINKINHEYKNSNANSRSKEKYSQKVVVRAYIVLNSLLDSAKSYIEKSIKEQNRDF